jgi:hypothetical protein
MFVFASRREPTVQLDDGVPKASEAYAFALDHPHLGANEIWRRIGGRRGVVLGAVRAARAMK